MDLRKKYWIFGIACSSFLPAVLFFLALFLYGKIPDASRALLIRSLTDILPVLLTICLLALMGILILLNEIFHNFILPLVKLKEEGRLITAARSSHRIALQGSGELRELADDFNRAAELIEALKKGFPEAGSPGKEKAVARERDVLGALLADLPGGVVAGNANGRIFLYTHHAADLVEKMQDNASKGPPVGLDRSIFAVFSAPFGLHGVPYEETVSEFQKKKGATFECNGVRGQLLKFDPGRKTGVCYLVLLQHAEKKADGGPRSAGAEGRGFGGTGKKSVSPFPNFDLSLLKPKRDRQTDIGDLNLSELTYTVFDLETTGLNPAGGDEIISIGAVRVVNGRILFEETFYQMVNPRGDIPEEATRVHGITRAMLQGQPGIEEVLPAFFHFIEDSVLVSHDAEFDRRFLQKHAQALDLKIDSLFLDTFHLSCLIQQTQRDHTIESIAGRLGTRIYDRHVAYGDAWTAAEILLKLISVLNAKGIRTLRQVRERRR